MTLSKCNLRRGLFEISKNALLSGRVGWAGIKTVLYIFDLFILCIKQSANIKKYKQICIKKLPALFCYKFNILASWRFGCKNSMSLTRGGFFYLIQKSIVDAGDFGSVWPIVKKLQVLSKMNFFIEKMLTISLRGPAIHLHNGGTHV